VSSENKSEFIENLMDDYKEDVRDERNIQPLSDDYIKFIRFAHWKIAQAGKGILGFITNNAYLSGVIHRGMRRNFWKPLMRYTFSISTVLLGLGKRRPMVARMGMSLIFSRE
jgi:predicted helicase